MVRDRSSDLSVEVEAFATAMTGIVQPNGISKRDWKLRSVVLNLLILSALLAGGNIWGAGSSFARPPTSSAVLAELGTRDVGLPRMVQTRRGYNDYVPGSQGRPGGGSIDRPPPRRCRPGYIGRPPHCVKIRRRCPPGTRGRWPRCRAIACPRGYRGRYPTMPKNSYALPARFCWPAPKLRPPSLSTRHTRPLAKLPEGRQTKLSQRHERPLAELPSDRPAPMPGRHDRSLAEMQKDRP